MAAILRPALSLIIQEYMLMVEVELNIRHWSCPDNDPCPSSDAVLLLICILVLVLVLVLVLFLVLVLILVRNAATTKPTTPQHTDLMW